MSIAKTNLVYKFLRENPQCLTATTEELAGALHMTPRVYRHYICKLREMGLVNWEFTRTWSANGKLVNSRTIFFPTETIPKQASAEAAVVKVLQRRCQDLEEEVRKLQQALEDKNKNVFSTFGNNDLFPLGTNSYSAGRASLMLPKADPDPE